jgi:hypothetical protein
VTDERDANSFGGKKPIRNRVARINFTNNLKWLKKLLIYKKETNNFKTKEKHEI